MYLKENISAKFCDFSQEFLDFYRSLWIPWGFSDRQKPCFLFLLHPWIYGFQTSWDSISVVKVTKHVDTLIVMAQNRCCCWGGYFFKENKNIENVVIKNFHRIWKKSGKIPKNDAHQKFSQNKEKIRKNQKFPLKKEKLWETSNFAYHDTRFANFGNWMLSVCDS